MTNLLPDAPATISSHFTHGRQGHKLKLVQAGAGILRCDGCMEHGGDGPRYRCEPCNFDLHTCCALSPATREHHLFPGCTFVLLDEPPFPAGGRTCDACGEGVHAHGLVYHCYDRGDDGLGLDLHPTCASLPPRFAVGGRDFELRKETSRRCAECGERCRRFWFYRSHVDGEAVYLHVACLKRMQNGAAVQSMQVIMSSPAMEGVLRSLPARRRATAAAGGGLKRFLTIVAGAIRVIIGIIFGDPTFLIEVAVGSILNF
uniref:DC1 domain-containing protein n=1 Tax=Oryza punctata TaxID=4537 RepID=A0A0E0LUQ9_ORYPU